MLDSKKEVMFGFLKKNPLKELQKEYKQKSEQAMQIQRSGDLRLYATVVEELEAIEKKIATLTA
jgi:precorrin-4 methylase